MSLRVAQVAVQHIIANTTNVRSIIRLYSVCARHGGQLSIMADVAKDRANRDISKNVLKNFGKLPYEETQAKNGGNKNKNTLSDGTFDYLGVITRAIRGAGFVKGVSSDALDDMIQIASMWLYQCSINTQENSNLFEKMDPEKPFAPFLAKATFHYVQRAQAQQAKHRQRNTPIEIEKDGESFNILDKLKVETTTFEDKKSEELYKKLVAAILKTLKEKDKEGGTNFAELFGRVVLNEVNRGKSQDFRDIVYITGFKKWGADKATINKKWGGQGDLFGAVVTKLEPIMPATKQVTSKEKAEYVWLLFGLTRKVDAVIEKARGLDLDKAADAVIDFAKTVMKNAPVKGAVPQNLIDYAKNAKDPYSPGSVSQQLDKLRDEMDEILSPRNGDPEVLLYLRELSDYRQVSRSVGDSAWNKLSI